MLNFFKNIYSGKTQEEKNQQMHETLSRELVKMGFGSPSIVDIADKYTSLYKLGDLIINLVIQENGVVVEYLADEGNGFYILTGSDYPIKNNKELKETLSHLKNLAKSNDLEQILSRLVLELRGKKIVEGQWEVYGVTISILTTNEVYLLDTQNTGQTFDNFDSKLNNSNLEIPNQYQENSQVIPLSKLNKGTLTAALLKIKNERNERLKNN